jgi:hypothetical protein
MFNAQRDTLMDFFFNAWSAAGMLVNHLLHLMMHIIGHGPCHPLVRHELNPHLLESWTQTLQKVHCPLADWADIWLWSLHNKRTLIGYSRIHFCYTETRAGSPIPNSNPLARSATVARRPPLSSKHLVCPEHSVYPLLCQFWVTLVCLEL